MLDAAETWRRRLEAEPVRFMHAELPGLLRAAASRLALTMGAQGQDLVFVDNATSGMNAVLRSLDLGAGAEILATSHGYGAVAKTLAYVAARTGARVTLAAIPFPVAGEEEILAAIAAAFTAHTRLLVIDHVTSPTALILPLARIAAFARERGVLVLVDGAHTPGMLELDLPALGVDWYVGNCHKWLMAPKGAGFLWAANGAQAGLHPPVISHGFGAGFTAEFDWTGTRDPGAWLGVVAALDFLDELGPARVRAHNRALLLDAVRLLSDAWWTPIGGPPDLLGAMATIGLPPALSEGRPAREEESRRLTASWRERHGIEVPAVAFAGRWWVRISAQVYNELDDYRRLAALIEA